MVKSGGAFVPTPRSRGVSGYANSVFVQRAEIEHGDRIATCSSYLPQQHGRARIRFRDALTMHHEPAKIDEGPRLAVGCGERIPIDSFSLIARRALLAISAIECPSPGIARCTALYSASRDTPWRYCRLA